MDKDKEIDEYMEFRRGLNKLSATPIKSSDYVSPLESDKMVVKGGTLLPEARTIIKGGNPSIKTNEVIGTIKGVTDKINPNSIQKISKYDDVMKKVLEHRAMSAAKKLAGQAGGMMGSVAKKIPVLGGLAVGLGTALATGDASAGEQAAVPLLNEAEDLGPTAGSLESQLESGNKMSPEEMEILRNRFSK